MKYSLIITSILCGWVLLSCTQNQNQNIYTSNTTTEEIGQTDNISSNTRTISIPVNFDPITQPDDPILSKEWTDIFDTQYQAYSQFMQSHLSKMTKFVDVNKDGRIDIRTGDQILTRVINVKRGVASFEKGEYEEESHYSIQAGFDYKKYDADSKLAKAFLYDNFYLFKLFNSDLFYERAKIFNKREEENRDAERQRVWDAYN